MLLLNDEQVMHLEVDPEVGHDHVNGNVPTMNGTADEKSTSFHVPMVGEPEVGSIVDVALKVDKPFPPPPATISYHTLRYYVTDGSRCRGRRISKQILHELRQASGVYQVW